jgi:ubiquinone/menaquinone biosynthesis C-methylase UbiE
MIPVIYEEPYSKSTEYSLDKSLKIFNKTNKETYDEIANEFSETRAYVWQCIKDFTSFINYSNTINKPYILEIGCGNGKNMEYLIKNTNCNITGIDNCEKFIQICKNKNLNVLNTSSNYLPFPNNSFDYILCIAMFHHLLTIEDQNITFKEILRVMKPSSYGILTCWSTIQPDKSTFKFSEGINIVPWKGRKNINKIRYYFVYSESMFRSYFESFLEINIIDTYNEFGNWILIFQKK